MNFDLKLNILQPFNNRKKLWAGLVTIGLAGAGIEIGVVIQTTQISNYIYKTNAIK